MRKIRNESGQSLIEYMILVALVVIVCVTAVRNVGSTINGKFKEIRERIEKSVPIRIDS